MVDALKGEAFGFLGLICVAFASGTGRGILS